jgi:uncharacterized membrane protein
MTTQMSRLSQRLQRVCLAIPSFAIALYALAFVVMPIRQNLPPEMRETFLAHRFAISLHGLTSLVALVLGPFQMIPLSPRGAWHRLGGKLYLGLGVLWGGVSGLYVATLAYGGLVARVGFGCLACAWLYTGLKGYLSARRGDWPAHRRWLIRNFALTLAAVTLRGYIVMTLPFGVEHFEGAYRIIAWGCWVPNLVLAEVVFNRSRAAVIPAS